MLGDEMVKRILVIFLIMILVMSPVSVYASSSGTLTVAPGSGSAVGGLFSDYGVNSKTTAIALTMVLLNSLGATVKLTDQAIQAGKKVEDVVMDKFAQWVGGSSAESMTESQREELKKRFKVINGGSGGSDQSSSDGPNIGPDGKIYFGLGALGILTEFIKFLKSNNDVKDVPVSDPDAPTSVDLGPFSTVITNEVYDTGGYAITSVGSGFYSTVPVAIVKDVRSNNRIYGVTFISNQYFERGITGYGITSRAGLYNGYYYTYASFNHWTTDIYPDDAYGSSYYGKELLDHLTKWEEQTTETDIEEDGIYKGENYDDSILDNPVQPIVVDPGILPNVTPDSDQQVSIPDYLQMIIDNLNANAAESQDPLQVPVTDPVTLSPGTLTVPVQEQDPINQPLPAETVAPENVPANPVQDPSTPVEPGDAIPRLTFPLDEYFPFCIPFDIYALLSKFTAEPVTPVFDVGFTEPFTNSLVNLHIDLTPWNGVATAIRTAELGAFIVGLALLSKQIFTRG